MEIADDKETKKVKRKSKKNKRKATEKITVTDYILAIVLLLVIVVTLYPFLNVLAVSLNDATDTARGGLTIFPREFTLQNYQEIFSSNNNLLVAFKNSVLRTVIGTVFSTFVCALFAYSLSKKDFIFRSELNVI